MAIDLLLMIPDIVGESPDAQHPGAIEVLAWSWGVANSVPAGVFTSGSGAATGKVSFHPLVITKHVDAATPKLFTACCTGKHLPTATLLVHRSGPQPFESMKLTLEDVVVTGLEMAESSGERITEQLTLAFGKVTIDYIPERPDGSAGDVVSATWNLRKAMRD